jgi:hypothetical protein
MGRLIVSAQMTADAVMDQIGEWFDPTGESELYGLDQLRAADALLLGRETYVFFSSVWPQQADGEGGFADVVVSPGAVGRGIASADRWAASDPHAADRRHDVQLRGGARQLPADVGDGLDALTPRPPSPERGRTRSDTAAGCRRWGGVAWAGRPAQPAMSYMNCPCCGLSIRLRASYLAIERCPRCLARRKVAVSMYLSQRPGGPPTSASPDDSLPSEPVAPDLGDD